MTVDIKSIEKLGEQIIQNIIDHETSINFIAGLAGVLPEVALAEKALPLIVSVLQFLQGETGVNPLDAFKDLVSHLTPGQPNADVLDADRQASTT